MKRAFIVIFFLSCILGIAWSRTRKQSAPIAEPSVLEKLSDLEHTSPSTWHQGMPFVFLADHIGLSLVPENPLESADTLPMFGSRWFYDSMVAEEDWMGQQLLQLRFLSPDGRAYRYSTGRPMSAISDTTYLPAIEVLYPEHLLHQSDSLLSSRTLFILYNDERVKYLADSTPGTKIHPKFVPITIDSVGIGNSLAPLCVYFSSGEERGCFHTSLLGARQVTTSTPINRFLSETDPYSAHPDITPEIWAKIQYSQVQIDMTAEEVRLSWGRPSRIERANSRTGQIEYWYYSNNRILQLWDGRVNKIGIL